MGSLAVFGGVCLFLVGVCLFLPYDTRDPKRGHNFDNHPYTEIRLRNPCGVGFLGSRQGLGFTVWGRPQGLQRLGLRVKKGLG